VKSSREGTARPGDVVVQWRNDVSGHGMDDVVVGGGGRCVAKDEDEQWTPSGSQGVVEREGRMSESASMSVGAGVDLGVLDGV
jgi:hypothetical protein